MKSEETGRRPVLFLRRRKGESEESPGKEDGSEVTE
jgi:hypothetical protein